MPTLRDKAQAEIDSILEKYPTKRSAVLPLCHLAQKEYGYMSAVATREVAAILELDPTEVQSLIGFYTLLREEKAGEYVIEVCDDLPCALRGADQFIDHVCAKLGVRPGETTDDGVFTLETVMCVAACHRAPVAQINQEYYENLDPEQFDALLDQLRNRSQTTSGDTDDDYDAMMDLWKQAGLSTLRPSGRDSRQAFARQSQTSAMVEPSQGYQTVLGLLRDNQLIGVVVATHDGRKGWINRLAIDPLHRRCGHAQHLIGAAEELLKKQGIQVIGVLIKHENATSLALFQRAGYRVHDDVHYLSKRDSDEA